MVAEPVKVVPAIAKGLPPLFGNDSIVGSTIKAGTITAEEIADKTIAGTELNDTLQERLVSGANYTIGAETANTRNIDVQFIDAVGDNIIVADPVATFWISVAPRGAPTTVTSFTVLTGIQIGQFGSNLALQIITVNGRFEVDVEIAGAATRFFNISPGDFTETSLSVDWV